MWTEADDIPVMTEVDVHIGLTEIVESDDLSIHFLEKDNSYPRQVSAYCSDNFDVLLKEFQLLFACLLTSL